MDHYDVNQIDALATKHGLEPYAGTKGSQMWECWADRVLYVDAWRERWGQEELDLRKAEANSYSGQAALRALRAA